MIEPGHVIAITPGLEASFVDVAEIVMITVLVAGIAQSAIYIFQLIVAAQHLSRRPPVLNGYRLWDRFAPVAQPCSIVAPVFNEGPTITDSVYAMLSQRYPHFEIIVVNDGSTDDTLPRLIEAFALELTDETVSGPLEHQEIRGVYRSTFAKRLRVIDKANGGKADAHNVGINASTTPLLCLIDGDSLIEPEALLRATAPFADDPERMVAVGATVRIANGSSIVDGEVREVGMPRRLVVRFQIVEYLRAFLMARLAWAAIDSSPLISGAFAIFRRDVLLEVAGYTRGLVGEDFDIVLKIHRHMRDEKRDYRITFVPEPLCWTEVPETARDLSSQRARWQNGALECFLRHRRMILNPGYGRVGLVVFGQMLLIDVLGPLIEVAGYLTIPVFWFFGALNTDSLLVLGAVAFSLGTFNSIGSLILAERELRPYPRKRDLLALGTTAIIENFGYRQWNNLWRLRGYWQFLRAKKDWGEIERLGFGAQSGGLYAYQGEKA